jgi:hypothetical protein
MIKDIIFIGAMVGIYFLFNILVVFCDNSIEIKLQG